MDRFGVIGVQDWGLAAFQSTMGSRLTENDSQDMALPALKHQLSQVSYTYLQLRVQV